MVQPCYKLLTRCELSKKIVLSALKLCRRSGVYKVYVSTVEDGSCGAPWLRAERGRPLARSGRAVGSPPGR